MSVALQLIVSGLALGSIYALLALSLVIINKATDVVNFAQGEMAMLGTFAALAALGTLKLPLWLVMVAAFPLGMVFGAIVERVAMRPLATQPPINALIATIGLFLVFHHLAGWIWGYDPYRFPSLFSTAPIELGSVRISQASLGILGVSLGVMVLLYLFYEHTRAGTAMRAASMNRRAARLM